MATGYGWFQGQRITSPSKLGTRTTTEGENSVGASAIKTAEAAEAACSPAATSAQISEEVGYGKSFRSQDRTLGEARTTCRAHPLSNRAVHRSSGFRPYRAMDEAKWIGGYSLLQPAGGGVFNVSSSGHGQPRVAVPTRWQEIEGHPFVASGARVCLKRDDLARLVAAFPHTTAGRGLAELPPGA